VLIDPRVVARLRAVLADPVESRTRVLVERPSLGAVIARRLWSVERPFALASIEAAEMPARQRHPDDALAVDVGAARAEAGRRHVEDLGQRGLWRVRSERHAHLR